ncbi:MAG TPA: DUF2281 domain-containing protein [Longimicrobium sp.]|jgi:hypothetical protein|nr:DUF2281 domain-containing protein [Longimicrobium sp.]
MHDLLRARLIRHIEALPEAQVYQALDYVEFLSSKYARESLREPGVFQKFSEMLEDKMRGQGLAFGTIKGALGVMGTAGRVVSGITEAGRTVIREVENVITPDDDAPPPAQLPRPARPPEGDPRGGQAAG